MKEINDCGDHFTTLRLPLPTLDVLERPVWEITTEEVERAYRKLVRWCHPDKRSNMTDDEAEECETAFKRLKKAKEILSDDEKSGPYVREWVVDHGLARKTKEKEAIENTDLVKSAEIMREREEERRKQMAAKRGEEQQELGSSIVKEMERKRKVAELARLEREKRQRLLEEDSDSDDAQAKFKSKGPTVGKKGGDEDEEEREARLAREKRMKNARRGRPRML